MRTVKTKVYQFSELKTKDAKQKAIEWYRNSIEWQDELTFFGDDCAERAAEQGFNNIKLQYSLNSCQGDGLSFSCTDFDLEKFLRENTRIHRELFIKVLAANLVYEIKGNTHRYCYASASDIDLYLDNPNRDYPNIQSLVDDLKTDLEDKYLQLCKEFEKTGYEWIDDINSDERIIENIEANEYEFTKDGNRF